MSSAYAFADARLAKLDGFQVEIDEAHERADIILNRPPFNVVSMPQRDQGRGQQVVLSSQAALDGGASSRW